FERFPADAPPRVTRRSAQSPGVATPAQYSAPQQVAAGTPPEHIAAVSSAPTRTVTPQVPGGAGPTAETAVGKFPVQSAGAVAREPERRSGGRGLMLGGGGGAVAAAAAVTPLIAPQHPSRGKAEPAPAPAPHAAVTIDAGAVATPVVETPPADAAVAPPVDAA